jgi:hypothetical protein
MEIMRVRSQLSGKGPSDWFTGIVRIDIPFWAIFCVRSPHLGLVTVSPRQSAMLTLYLCRR